MGVAGLWGAAMPAAVAAQLVRGSVTDSATGRGLIDATVALTAGGGAVATALTDSAGRFTLRAAPGSYAVELRRIGYRTAPPSAVTLAAGETVRHDVRLVPAPLTLSALRTESRSRCTVNPVDGSAAAMLWAEVTKALDATALTQQSGAARVTVRDTERELDPRTRTTRSETRAERTGTSAAPYGNPSPDSLATHGYVQEVGGTTWYYGPTVDVLTAPSFAATHCIEVTFRRPPAPGLVGIRFEPTRDRRVVDVSGTIWIDLTSAALRRVDFAYTGLPRWPGPTDFGGQVEFERLAGAGWIVRRWVVRAPVVGLIERSALVPGSGGTVTGSRVVTRREPGLVAIREVVGEVVDAAPAPSALVVRSGTDGRWSVGRGTVRGVAFDSVTALPLAGAVVAIEGTDHRATAAADGRYELPQVLAGRQTLTLSHPAAVALTTPRRTIDVAANDTTTADVALPTVATALTLLCPSHPPSADTGAVYGRATALPTGTAVVVSWTRYARSGIDRLQAVPETRRAPLEPDGAYRVCGVPAGVAVRVQVADQARPHGPALSLVIRDPLLARVDVHGSLPQLVDRAALVRRPRP